MKSLSNMRTAFLTVILTGSVIAAPMQGQIIIDPENPSWMALYDSNGEHKPFFMYGPGDPEGILYGDCGKGGQWCESGMQGKIIDHVKSYGGNSLYFIAVRSHGGDGTPTQNPFIDHDPNRGVDMHVLDQWETWFTECDNAGIVINFFFYDDGAKPFGFGNGTIGNKERNFIHTCVNRFKHHKYLIWYTSEELSECMSAEHARKFGAEIRSVDEHEHPIGTSQLPGTSFKIKGDPYIKIFDLQVDCSSPDNCHEVGLDVRREAEGSYNIVWGDIYPYAWNLLKENKRDELRWTGWAAAMAGVHVMHGGTWHKRWNANPSADILRDMKPVVDFFNSIPDLNKMKPEDNLRYGATKFVLARQGISYIAYSRNAGIGLGIKNLSQGNYNLKWIDCISGDVVNENKSVISNGDHSWPIPSGIGNECAVYITKLQISKTVFDFRIADKANSNISMFFNLNGRLISEGQIQQEGLQETNGIIVAKLISGSGSRLVRLARVND